MKKILCSLFLLMVSCSVAIAALVPGIPGHRLKALDAYDQFNLVYLDSAKYIYKDLATTTRAVDRWHGAAAIWCQAIFYEMALQAYQCACKSKDAELTQKYKENAIHLLEGNRKQYVNFNFDDCNTNTGWFVYDDIMWWTIAFAHAYQTLGEKEYLQLATQSFDRVWSGSKVVGDDGSYANPKRGLGGGMFWEWQPIDKPTPHQPGDFRSACINFPTVIAACLLYQSTHKKHYLRKAREIFSWADMTLVKEGRVADGIHDGPAEWNDHLYNQATYIGASKLLYQLTGDVAYKQKATAALSYTRKMSPEDILPREYGPEQGVYTAIYAMYASDLETQAIFPTDTSASHYADKVFPDVYHASGLPALLLFREDL